MKELSIEQKATAYEDLLKKAKQYYDTENDVIALHFLEELFPELKESEDERIRKEILQSIRDNMVVIHKDKCIAWLEKQEGCEYIKKDWLEHIKQSWYKEGFIDGKYSGGTSKEWTINDAAIFKEIIDFLENGTAKLQHDLTKYANWLKIQFTPIEKQGKQFSVDKLEPKFKVGDKIRRKTPSSCDKDMQVARIEKDYYICNHIGKFSSEVVPFSKESRYELVEQKPAEWGEEDENTIKVLMNIIRKSEIIDSIIYTDSLKEKLYDWLKSLKDRVQPKQEWSEKDETKMRAALAFIKSEFPKKGDEEIMEDTIEWLKSLRPQKPTGWSEEDEKMISRIRSAIEKYAFSQSAVDVNGDLCEKIYIDMDNWLKSIKERYTWKPSDEQIEALGVATDICSIPEKHYDELNKLYQDLKKLTE